MKDQNETVYIYHYDGLGRLIEDQVSVLGEGIDVRCSGLRLRPVTRPVAWSSGLPAT